MKLDSFLSDKVKCAVDAFGLDAVHSTWKPSLVHFVFGEAVASEQARAEIAVNHAHRRVAEHESQDALAANFRDDFSRQGLFCRGHGCGEFQLVFRISDL